MTQGITAAGGLLVDPAGRVWVSDSYQGFCRLAEASISSLGGIETSTCLGGAGAAQRGPSRPGTPALLDPTPGSAGSGDELALIPDASANSSAIVRARWDVVAAAFRYANTLTLYGGDLRPQGVTVGPDGSAYVVFDRTRSVVRIVDPASTQPTIETVAFLSANGARAIAAGAADATGRVTLYVAEGSQLSSFLAPRTGPAGLTPATSYPVGAVTRLYYEPTTRALYAGTAAAIAAGGDRITRVDTTTGQVDSSWALGFSRVGGITVRGSLVLAVDDPGLLASPAQVGKGTAYVLGEVLPRITAGPTSANGSQASDPAITNDATPTFKVAVDGGAPLQCTFDVANWTACVPGDVTASPSLADGPHQFAVRVGPTGTPVVRQFTVDTTRPSMPLISVPASGSTVGASFVLKVSAEEGVTLRCALDGAASGTGAVCAAGQAFTITRAGEHTLRITATDRVGNVSETAVSTFTVDTAAPRPVITAPATDGQTLTGAATFEFSAGAEAGLTYRCRVDTLPFEVCTSPRTYNGLSAGAHSFTVEAGNSLGNSGTATRTFQLVVPDTDAPIVTVSPAAGTYHLGQQITLATDEPATVHFTTDGSAPTTASPVYGGPIVLSTAFTLRYFAVDTHGNASTPASQSYEVRTLPPPSGEANDYDNDGHDDVIALTTGGSLWLYRGNGSGGWLGWHQMAEGWNDVDAIITPGDWEGDGYPDLLARSTNGELRLARGDGDGGIGVPQVVATGWGALSMLFSPGDWDGDDLSDVLARDSAGRLLLYSGDGSGGLSTARVIGSGWNVMTAVFSPGDWDGDGASDVLARDGSGALLLYPGDGSGGWRATRVIGSGWNVMTAILGPGDWDGDGASDVLARDGSGALLLYPGDGSGGWRATRVIGSGWGGMTVIS